MGWLQFSSFMLNTSLLPLLSYALCPGEVVSARVLSMSRIELCDHLLRIVIIFTNPSARAGYDTRSVFKRSLTGFIAGGRIIGYIPFPRVLELCEMQSLSSRIWTRIVVSNSYDDNHYTTELFLIVIWNHIYARKNYITKKCLIDTITNVKLQYLKPFNSMKTNDWY